MGRLHGDDKLDRAWLLFPAYGERSDARYNFKWAIGYESYPAFGRNYDQLTNGESLDKYNELLAHSCNATARGSTARADRPRATGLERGRSHQLAWFARIEAALAPSMPAVCRALTASPPAQQYPAHMADAGLLSLMLASLAAVQGRSRRAHVSGRARSRGGGREVGRRPRGAARQTRRRLAPR